MDWERFELGDLAREIRANGKAVDAEKMIWAFEEAVRVARIDPDLLSYQLAAVTCLLARLEGTSPRSVLEAFFRRSIPDEQWRDQFLPAVRIAANSSRPRTDNDGMAVPERSGRLWRLVESPFFTALVLTVILANAVVLGLQTYEEFEREHGDTLALLNAIFLGFFVVELSLRIAAYGRRPQDFFRSGWNIFDFVVIAMAFVPGIRESSTLLRIARLMRVVRVVRVLPDLRLLVEGVARSLPPLGSMVLLTTLIIFVYGMFGWLLFGDELPQDWGNIGTAMLSLFVILTLEDFPRYMFRAMEVHQWAWIYFVTYVGVAVFIVVNVLIAIVLNSMEEARELERRRRLTAGREAGAVAPAPVLERIAILRAALEELEEELAQIPVK